MRCVRTWRAPLRSRACICRVPGFAFAALAAMTLAGCVSNGQGGGVAQQASGNTIAFESIDGPPEPVFQKMVDSLTRAAARRNLTVVSRQGDAAYRVRGYFAANVVRGRTHIDWVWDVYDVNRRRAFRINGDEATGRGLKNAWSGADEKTVDRIADTTVERLAAFTGGPAVAPSAPVAGGAAVAAASATTPAAVAETATTTAEIPALAAFAAADAR